WEFSLGLRAAGRTSRTFARVRPHPGYPGQGARYDRRKTSRVVKTKKTPNAERRTSNVEVDGWCVAEVTGGDYGRQTRPVYDLEERRLGFAANIIELTESLPNTRAGNHVAGQLLRCGTSSLSNHGEVEAAESRRDFLHKLRICLKELRET